MKDPIYNNQKFEFAPVFYSRFPVQELTSGQIDELLVNGWFRNDLHVQSTMCRYVEGAWRPSVMLRLPLQEFKWKKRLRKILRNNKQEFQIRVAPYQPRQEIEALWHQFKSEVHGWKRVPNLYHHVFRGIPPAKFNSWEVSIYYQKKLVGFSIFDRGNQSLASLEAAYDPSFSKYSLGLFSMLIEIEYGLENNLRHYYPGFYPKGISMFDYKTRPGGVEFFRIRSNEWVPWEMLQEKDWVFNEVMERLNEVKTRLSAPGLFVFTHINQPLSQALPEPKAPDYNILLYLEERKRSDHKQSLKIAWDPFRKSFLVFIRQAREKQRIQPSSNARMIQAANFNFKYAATYRNLDELLTGIRKLAPFLRHRITP